MSDFQRITTKKQSPQLWEAGDYFFVPIIIMISTLNEFIKESDSYVLMLYHLPLGDGSHSAVGTACTNYQDGKKGCVQRNEKVMLVEKMKLQQTLVIKNKWRYGVYD